MLRVYSVCDWCDVLWLVWTIKWDFWVTWPWKYHTWKLIWLLNMHWRICYHMLSQHLYSQNRSIISSKKLFIQISWCFFTWLMKPIDLVKNLSGKIVIYFFILNYDQALMKKVFMVRLTISYWIEINFLSLIHVNEHDFRQFQSAVRQKSE